MTIPKSFLRLTALFFVFLLMTSCVIRDTLHLQNILEFDIEQKALRKAKVAKKAMELSKKKSLEARSQTIIEEPLDPAELNLLKFPDAMKLIRESDLNVSGAKEKIEPLFPGFTEVWACEGCNITVLAGKVLLNSEMVRSLSERELTNELENMARLYQEFYRTNFKTKAATEIKKIGALSMLKIESKYLADSEWRTDLRYFYFYNPSYRLKMLITGPDKDFEQQGRKIRKAMKVFEKKLSKFQPV